MINTDNLEYGVKYDLTTRNGYVHKGWYLYDSKCGYFSKEQGTQTEGFIYSESIASITKSK